MKRIFVVLIICMLIGSCSVRGGDISVVLENDLFRSDRHYSHGTKLLNLCDGAPEWTDYISNKEDRRFGVGLAQYMYTPSSIKIEELMEDDRPYGGWLYLEALLISRDDRQLDLIGIDVGLTGEASMADDTQSFIHESFDNQIPMGWDNQIETELGVNIIYQKKIRLRYKDIFDFIPQAGASLGNIFTYANAGMTMRVGYKLPDNFGTLRMEPTTREYRILAGYLFAGVEGRYVLRNIFLDGNTFEDSHSVHKEEWVGDISVGAGVDVGNFEILYSNTYRGREFKGQKVENVFSSVILSWKY